MVVAENRLSSDIIRDGLLQHAADWPASMLHYQDARGIIELRTTLARMVQRTFMKVCADIQSAVEQQQQHHEAKSWLSHRPCVLSNVGNITYCLVQ